MNLGLNGFPQLLFRPTFRETPPETTNVSNIQGDDLELTEGLIFLANQQKTSQLKGGLRCKSSLYVYWLQSLQVNTGECQIHGVCVMSVMWTGLANIHEPILWSALLLKTDQRSQKRLKLSKKKIPKKSHEPYKWTEAMCGGYGFCLKTRTVTDCGNGISDKNSPQDLNILKRQVKSDCCTAVSFNPICIITLFMGVMEVKPGAFSEWQMVTPGKQCVTALKKHTFLVMESPKITVDGDKKKARLYQGKTEHNQMSLDKWS